MRKELQGECRKAYCNYINSLVSEDDSPTSKKLWSFIKKQKCDYCGVAPLEDCGTIHNEPQEKADILNKFFASVFTKDNSSLPEIESDPIPNMAPIEIHTDGVLHLLLNLKVSKATGPDKIPCRLLKELAYQIPPALTLLYRASIIQGAVPSDWKMANIVPIFKKGSKSSPSNYRPISLTSICCKILEHIIYSGISHHLEEYNVIHDEQHGFRSGRSCETQLLITIHDFANNLNNQKQTDAILLDFTKAFDKVSHRRLCSKLFHYGIRGTLLSWINDFLTGRTQRVLVDGCCSDDTSVTSGVPQGTVLAPLLFLMFINDLPENIASSIKLYADDVLIYRTIESEHDHTILQQDLNKLQKWANAWLMLFNPTKCESICISNKKNPIVGDYYIQNTPIRSVSSVKYLGVTIDERLSFNEHINRISHRANSIKAFLQRNIKSCPLKVKDNCYKTMVRPIMEYACTVWSPYTRKTYKVLKQYKEGQHVLSKMITDLPPVSRLCCRTWNGLHLKRGDGQLKQQCCLKFYII